MSFNLQSERGIYICDVINCIRPCYVLLNNISISLWRSLRFKCITLNPNNEEIIASPTLAEKIQNQLDEEYDSPSKIKDDSSER